MLKDKLQVGVRGFSVEVIVDIPQNLSEVASVSKGHDDYIVAKFVRGYRIDLQEGGARQVVAEMIAGKDAGLLKDPAFYTQVREAVEAEISAFDPAAPRSRGGRPAKPVVVNLPKKKSYTADELQALLAASGIKVVSE